MTGRSQDQRRPDDAARRTRTSRSARRTAVLAGAACLGALSLSEPAIAVTPYTVDFTVVGAHTWQVPAGVTAVDVTVSGGQGGLLLGGAGATVTAHVPVTPGQTLDVNVAGAGSGSTGGFGGGGDGGLNSTTAPLSGGGGGGASSIVVDSASTVLVVAGGGGGAALPVAAGGPSGTIGSGTALGGTGGPGGPGTGSGAGAGGAGGSAALIPLCALGGDGTAGSGGNAGSGGAGAGTSGLLTSGAGGGGGGYYGGGGGGTGGSCVGEIVGLSSGSGGGGSSFVTPSATNTAITQGAHSGDGAVEISYVDDVPPAAAPQVTPQPNAQGWVSATSAQITWNWSDGLSGISSSACTTSSTDTTQGVSVEHASCTDQAGNTANAVVDVRLDHTRPTVAVKKPLHKKYHRHAKVRASYRCTDQLSGVATCTGTTSDHGLLNTRKLGKHTLTVTATDLAGNKTVKKVTYRVVP